MIDVFNFFGNILGQCVQALTGVHITDSVNMWDITMGLLVARFALSVFHYILGVERSNKE